MPGKQPFHEDYHSDKVDPLHSTTVDFDMHTVETALGESTHKEQQDEIAELTRKLFAWVTDVDLSKKNAAAVVGRRFIALAWVLNPGLFDGSPSAGRLATMLGLTRKADFYTLTGEASREFGITNRAQDHAWNRGKAAATQPPAGKRDTEHQSQAEPSSNVSQAATDENVTVPRPRPVADMSKESFSEERPKGGSKTGLTVSAVPQKPNVP